MTWVDRLREAAYTPPSGERLPFLYEDVSESVRKRTTAFEFPDADGTFVQDLGRTGRQYPLRVFFSGDNHDTEADTFMAALLERGIGKLEHPRYGQFDVVPFGAITRRDDLKTAANQTVFDVTFYETIRLVYPTPQVDPAASVQTSITDYNGAQSDAIDEIVVIGTAFERTSLRQTYENTLSIARAQLEPVAAFNEEIALRFDTIVESINTGLDTLVQDPLTLALQTVILLELPARAGALFSDRFQAYRDLADALISGDGAAVPSDEPNVLPVRDLFASTAVAGAVLAALDNQFDTKVAAVQAADDLLTLFDDVAAWRDTNYGALEIIDTGAAYQQLQEATTRAAGFLVDVSFSLAQERRLILDRARTVIDLSAELYGEVDDRLDFFIASNQLTGSEILELPKGREIVYYV